MASGLRTFGCNAPCNTAILVQQNPYIHVSLPKRNLRCTATSNGRPGRPALEQERDGFFTDNSNGAASSSGNVHSSSKKKKNGDSMGNLGDRPYRTIPGLGKFYLDELDVITLLNPPRLSPLDPARYNHAAYVWKKIGDIPEERRTRLLDLINSNLMQCMWQVTGKRYYSPKLFPSDAFSLLPIPELEEPFITTAWRGKLSGDFWPWSWLKDIRMEFFIGKDGGIYGHLTCYGLFGSVISRYMPLYFKVRPSQFVSTTNDHCDLVLDFCDGELHLIEQNLPPSFREPEKVAWPLQGFVVHIRPVGPGVLVGQLWEGRPDPRQAPPRNLGQLVLIKNI